MYKHSSYTCSIINHVVLFENDVNMWNRIIIIKSIQNKNNNIKTLKNIKRIVLDLHDEIVDSQKVVLFEYEMPLLM